MLSGYVIVTSYTGHIRRRAFARKCVVERNRQWHGRPWVGTTLAHSFRAATVFMFGAQPSPGWCYDLMMHVPYVWLEFSVMVTRLSTLLLYLYVCESVHDRMWELTTCGERGVGVPTARALLTRDSDGLPRIGRREV